MEEAIYVENNEGITRYTNIAFTPYILPLQVDLFDGEITVTDLSAGVRDC